MIVSRENRRLKDMRRLRRCKDEDRALLEGPRIVRDALAAGVEIEYSLATPDFLASPAARELIDALSSPPLPVAPRLLEELADADSPRGLLATARLPTLRLADLPPLARPLVFLDGAQDPGNLGAVARAAEAAGACALALAPGTVHPNHPRALRGSAGSLLRLPVVRNVEPSALRARYPVGEVPFVALDPQDGEDLWRADLAEGIVLLLGGEGRGLTATTRAVIDRTVTIPIEPPVESLNLAVAAGLVLFELARRRALDS